MTSVVVRPMRVSDLPAVFDLQCRAYPPGYHEPTDALASRLALGPAFCFVALAGDAVVGYVFAHPWAGPPPALHTPLPACEAADHVFFHDLAVCPLRRGVGAAQRLLDALFAAAHARAIRSARLVAVGEAQPFWRRHGFSTQSIALHPSYGEAQHMARSLIANAH
ncbi:GNAT family N-acetyltransferase [Uliginosibacterium sp. sgz301328]|uniref:GNAT family N-acetyltransferase n=1 Tax=Uliginosibacterium sp. sgz301328 TaxID=3243764 RepID=UPI00359D3444